MANTQKTLKRPRISILSYLSLVFTVALGIVLFWGELPNAFLWYMIPILIVALISQATGVKKVSPKMVLDIIMENVKTAKLMHSNDPQGILDHIETALVFLAQVWDEWNEFVQDIFFNKDGKRDGKINLPVEKEEEDIDLDDLDLGD